ncbi:Ribonuclease H-like superfamily [Sesbania bispinosa]|nr:Ribonuclease H-like superfamily [Sesbania bispinosa]
MPPKTEKPEKSERPSDDLLAQCLSQMRDMQFHFDQQWQAMAAEVSSLRDQLVVHSPIHSTPSAKTPKESQLRLTLLTEFHASPVGGHSSIRGTLARLAASFSWPHMVADVKIMIQECSMCQQTATLAPMFMTEIYRLHGMPKTIVSDRDRVLINKFWPELFRLSGTTLAFSSAYHPQTDGQTEVTNHILETYLRCFVSDEPRRWFQYLYLSEYWYNSSFHSSLRMSPFEALYGRSPPTIRSYVTGSTTIAAIDESLMQRRQMLQVIRDNLGQAQIRMLNQFNAHLQDRNFKVGDWVFLRLQPYRQISVRSCPSKKLAKRYFGPFQIVRTIGPVAYQLALPPDAKVHHVFHISKLKPFYGTPPSHIPPLPFSVTGTRLTLRPLHILGSRTLRTPKGPQLQFLVQWEGQTELESTWEDAVAFKTSNPAFNLEDKVVLEGDGNDTYVGPSKDDHINPSQEQQQPNMARPQRNRKIPNWMKDYC